MISLRRILPILVLAAAPLGAQSSSPVRRASADTPPRDLDDEGVRLGLQFGVSSGALGYQDGRTEQAVSGILRWAPVRWFAIAATPSAAHASTPALATGGRAVSHSGLLDLPIAATVSHSFDVQYAPLVSGGLGLSLPTGNAATGFGSGQVGSELELEAGFSPTDRSWVSLGAGRSLSGVATQSAFSSGPGWGDLSAGFSLSERLSMNGGYTGDVGPVDASVGRSTSVNAGFGYTVKAPATLNVSASHGLSGIAPRWSLAIGVGSAFPLLGHASASPLRKTFGNSSRAGVAHGP
jgi:hypothetical protein